jgi:hypothetical protein
VLSTRSDAVSGGSVSALAERRTCLLAECADRWCIPFEAVREYFKTVRSEAQVHTYVKVLRDAPIFCQRNGCGQPATHVFTSGSVAAYCESHARAEADRIGLGLPVIEAEPANSRYFSRAEVIGNDAS